MGNDKSKAVKSHDSMRSYRLLFCFTRRFGGPAFIPPEELQKLYDRYLDENGHLTVAKLQNFLFEIQGKVDATEQDAQHIMETLRGKKHLSIFHRHSLPFEAFLQYLFDEDLNSAIGNQGHGKNLWLVNGFFRANGGCGYVKKPDFLLESANSDGDNDQNIFDPKVQKPLKTILKVKVYMGDGWRYDFKKTYFDRYSPPDFYTKIGIVGVTADSTTMKKTRAIEDNWIPCWGTEFTFPLTVPELALLRIQVNEYDMSEKADFGGQTCLPVRELKSGIRCLPLFNKKGEKYKSVKLLLRIEFV